MAALICENCGAPLVIITPDKLAQCPYCRTNYTLPLHPIIDEKYLAEAAPYMDRGRIYLSDKLFSNAAEYFDMVLKICPTYGEAYLLRGFCDLKIKFIEEIDLRKKWTVFENYYISKAMVYLSDEMKNDLLKKLEITSEEYEKEVAVRNWKKRAFSIRNAFVDAYKKEHPIYCEDVKQKIEDVSEKYKHQYAELKKEIDKYDRIIGNLGKKLKETSVYNVGDSLYYNMTLDDYKAKRAELVHEMAVLNDTVSKEQGEVFSSVKVESDDTDINSIQALSKLYPIPELVIEDDALLNDRIMYICLSRYEPFTFEEIISHPMLGSTNEKRVISCIKRMVTNKELFSYEKDGTTYYMPTDIAWIFAPEKAL